MLESSPASPPAQRSDLPPARLGQRGWLINALILLLATVIMLAMCEGVMRWLDGYDIFGVHLEQSNPGGQQVAPVAPESK